MSDNHIPKTTPPIPITLTGDEEWVRKEGKTIGITLKQYREWMQNQGEVMVVTFNPNASVTVDTENKLVICADECGNKTVMKVTRILKGEDVVWEKNAKEADDEQP